MLLALPWPRAAARRRRRFGRPASVPALAALLAAVAFLAPATPAGAGTPLDVNTADAATLAATLPGIGPVKAARIVAHREAHGPFRDAQALLAVPGIGPATLARIAPLLAFAGSAVAAGATGAGRTGEQGDPPYASTALEPSARERAVRDAIRRLVDLALEDAATRGAAAGEGAAGAGR